MVKRIAIVAAPLFASAASDAPLTPAQTLEVAPSPTSIFRRMDRMLAFISDRGGTPALYVMSMLGAEAERLGRSDEAAGQFRPPPPVPRPACAGA